MTERESRPEDDHRPLSGRVALITGAASGIGEATARALARRGCNLLLAARRLDRLQSLAGELTSGQAGVDARPVRLDVSQPGEVADAVRQAEAWFGSIDILVNNAGIGRMDRLEALDPEDDIQQQVAVNLTGAILASRAVLPGMLRSGRGHIIQVGSMASFVGTPLYSIYAATKFGLRGFSESLRREVRSKGIRVSTVYPGGVRTGFGRTAGASRGRVVRTPSWLVLTPEQVGEAIARLALRPRRTLVLPALMAPVVWGNALLPGLVDWVVDRFIRRRNSVRPSSGNAQSG